MAKPTRRSTCSCGHPPLVETPPPDRVPDAWFDQDAVDRVVRALGLLRHTKGRWARTPLILEPWQIEHIIAPVFGWKHRDGTRIRRTAWVEEPRKNGKSTLSSGLGIVLLVADRELGAEVYAAAGAKSQARIVHEPAKQMVLWSPDLSGKLKVLAEVITVPGTGGIFRVVSSVADLAHGLNVHGAIIDEVHVHKSRDLIDALETGTGARQQPLVMFITTADEGDEFSIYAEKHTYTLQLASGAIEDPTHHGVIWAAEEGDNPFDEEVWAKANPNLGVTVSLEYLRKEAAKAKASPSYLPTFERLHLGLRRRSVAKFLRLDKWDRAAGIWTEADWKGRIAYGGLDLSSNTDLTAFGLTAVDDDGSRLADTLCWLPEGSLERVEYQCHVPLQRWAKEGWLKVTEGDVVDYRKVREDIVARIAELGCKIAEIGYDPFAATETVQYLEDEGYTMVPLRQTYLTLSPPLKALERLVLASTPERPLYRHRGHPVLRWMADCCDVNRDPSDNIKPAKPDRGKSSKRIDGIAAHTNALARALVREAERAVPMPDVF